MSKEVKLILSEEELELAIAITQYQLVATSIVSRDIRAVLVYHKKRLEEQQRILKEGDKHAK